MHVVLTKSLWGEGLNMIWENFRSRWKIYVFALKWWVKPCVWCLLVAKLLLAMITLRWNWMIIINWPRHRIVTAIRHKWLNLWGDPTRFANIIKNLQKLYCKNISMFIFIKTSNLLSQLSQFVPRREIKIYFLLQS